MPPQALPKGFVPDVVETPKGFVPDETSTHDFRGAGASGSWDVPTPKPKQSTLEHGVRTVVTPFADFGRGAVDAVTGAVNMGIDALHTDPASQIKLASSIITPTIEEQKKAKASKPYSPEQLSHQARSIPLVGPFVGQLYDEATHGHIAHAAGMVAAGGLMEGVGGELPSEPTFPGPKLADSIPVPPHMQRSSIITLGSRGWRDSAPYGSPVAGADIVRELLPQAASELEHESGSLPKRGGTPVKETFPSGSILATDKAKNAKLRAGETFVGSPTEEGIAQRAVDITERPIQRVLKEVGSGDPTLDRMDGAGQTIDAATRTKIINELEANAASQDTVNPAFAKSIRNMKTLVETAKSWDALNELKKRANKESSRYGKLSEGGKIDASESIGAAWSDLGDTIRAHMYPELERIYNESHPGTPVNLREAGIRQSALIDFRNGASKAYKQAVLDEGAHSASTALERFSTKSGSTSDRGITRRAIGAVIGKTPAGEFNTLVQRSMGRGGLPELPPGNTLYGPGQPNPVTISGQQHDLIAHDGTILDPIMTGQHPLMPAPPGTSHAVGEDIFRIQQRAGQDARAAEAAAHARGTALWNSGASEARPVNAQGELLPHEGPGMLAGPNVTIISAEPDFITHLKGQKMWRDAQSAPTRGQLDLLRGQGTDAKAPIQTFKKGAEPSVFGTKGSTLGETSEAAIPDGTQLEFKSKMLDGREAYHYVTPEGRRFTTDAPISHAKTKLAKYGPPPEPGTHYSNPAIPPPPAMNKGVPKFGQNTPYAPGQ